MQPECTPCGRQRFTGYGLVRTMSELVRVQSTYAEPGGSRRWSMGHWTEYYWLYLSSVQYLGFLLQW